MEKNGDTVGFSPCSLGPLLGFQAPLRQGDPCNHYNATARTKDAVDKLTHCVYSIKQEKIKCSTMFLI